MTIKAFFEKISRKESGYFLLLVLGFLGAFAFRVYNLNFEGLWNDELFTAATADPSKTIPEIMEILRSDIHPPLHNFLSYYWCHYFGYDDTSLRILNVIIGSLGVISVYHLAKLLFNRKVAVWALVLAIVNAYLIRYSQEVRAYALLFLLTNYSYYFFLKLQHYRKWNFLNVCAYLIITTALLYTHYFGAFAIFGQGVLYLIGIYKSGFKKFNFKILLLFIIPVLSFGFWWPILQSHMGREADAWRDAANFETLYNYFRLFFNNKYLGSLGIISLLISIFILTYNRIRRKEKKIVFVENYNSSILALVVWFLAFLTIPFIRTLLSESMLVHRYFIGVLAPIVILLAFYIVQLDRIKILRIIFPVIVLYSCYVLFTESNPYYHRATMFREGVVELKKMNKQPFVLYQAKSKRYWEYYTKQYRINGRARAYFGPFQKMIGEAQPNELFVLLDI